ncbi:MAG: sulfotransferase family 2 domain-containing protein [Candidatus Magnetomorum sp.]|nr:sulfotransferase family 2 domain-containing protein [Candidatus Magnetomorum sp.]
MKIVLPIFCYDISGYKRIYHIHNEKTAGTSINYIFLSLGGEKGEIVYGRMLKTPGWVTVSNDKIYTGWNKELIEQGHYYYGFSHIPTHMLQLPSKTFTFTCFRDPINRFISNYKEQMSYKINNIKHPSMKIRSNRLGHSFFDYMLNVPREFLLGQLYMFSKTFDINEAYDRIQNCSHYFFTEQFSTGLKQLSSKSGISLEVEAIHARKSSNNEIEISDKDKYILRDLLNPEYILLDKLKKNYGAL